MIYSLLRPLLFLLPPETAHTLTLKLLRLAYRLGLLKFLFPALPPQPIQVAGLIFKNRVGIAAGLDKNGEYIAALATLGVGFIEVGAVTPKAQQGNPKPRLFRLPNYQALINRMGFNNKGVDYLVEQLKEWRTNHQTDCIIGVNLGKNKDTALEDAANDYNFCLEKIFPYADFATINISSPNTPGIRQLQTPQYIAQLLAAVKAVRDCLQKKAVKKLPLFVKIAPDLTDAELEQLLDAIQQIGMDGVIQTNTTLSRTAIANSPLAAEAGGLSGKPLAQSSLDMLKKIRHRYPQLPVISVGGIDSPQEAQQRFACGADLIQLYTGLIYKGPQLLRRILKEKS